jgi:hypothetical protein
MNSVELPLQTPTTNHNPAQWTDRQGQYLAFNYAYTTIRGQAPAERDMEGFFRTSPPSVRPLRNSASDE